MILLGAGLAAWGSWLLLLGGSVWYLTVGVAVIVSGYLLIQRRAEGAWLYLLPLC